MSFFVNHVETGTAFYKPKDSLGPRKAEVNLLVRINRGSAKLRLNGQTIPLEVGDIVFSQTNDEELWLWDEFSHTEHDYIHWEFDWLPKDFPDKQAWPTLINADINGLLHALFDNLLSLSHSRHENLEILIKRSMQTLISTFIHNTDRKVKALLFSRDLQSFFDSLCKEWSVENYVPPSIPEICKITKYSKPQLIRIFKRELGATPAKFCEHLRLHVSATLLINESLSIEEIALRLGYENQFHYSRNFKKFYLYSPLKYRKKFYLQPKVLSEQPSLLVWSYTQLQRALSQK